MTLIPLDGSGGQNVWRTMIKRVQQRWRDEPSGWWRTSVVLAGMALLLFLALAVTGVVLSRVYRPDLAEAYPDLPGVEPSAGAADALRTVGEDLNGIWGAAFDDGVRFVLVDGTEVSPGTYARWAIAHTIVVPLLVLSLGVALARNLTRRPPPDGFW